MQRKAIILLVSTMPAFLIWQCFYEENQWAVDFWTNFGLDLNKEYAWFLFAENDQKPRWYIHYTAYYYCLIICSWCLWKYANFSRLTRVFMRAFFWFNLFRAVEYWLFRWHLSYILPVAGMIIFSLFTIRKKWRTG